MSDSAPPLPDYDPNILMQNNTDLHVHGSRRFTIGKAIAETFAVTFACKGGLLFLYILLSFGLALAGKAAGFRVINGVNIFGSIAFPVVFWLTANAVVHVIQARARDARPRLGAALGSIPKGMIRGFLSLVVGALSGIIVYAPTIIVAIILIYSGQGKQLNAILIGITFIINSYWGLGVILVSPLVLFEGRYFAFRRSMALVKGKRLRLICALVCIGFTYGFISGFIGGFSAGMARQGAIMATTFMNATAVAFSQLIMASLIMVTYQLLLEEKEGGNSETITEVFS